MPAPVQSVIEFDNRLIDPGFGSIARGGSAGFNHLAKGEIDGHHKRRGAYRSLEAAGKVHLIKWQNPALIRVNQKQAGVIAPICHRECPACIAGQQFLRAKALAHAGGSWA